VTLENVGSNSWIGSSGGGSEYTLTILEDKGGFWTDKNPYVNLVSYASVVPNQRYTFPLLLHTPGVSGRYRLKMQMNQEGVGLFGDIIDLTIDVLPEGGNGVSGWLTYR
jgi:hypothetical protein